MAHPGILTMWAGAAAFFVRVPDYADLVPGNLEDVRRIPIVLNAHGFDPLDVIVAAKVSKVLLQGVFFAIALEYLRRLFSPSIMLCAGALIAFDPFLSGLDSLLHVDGMFAITSFSAVLGLAYAFRSCHTTTLPWVFAGVLASCAWLTRATGLLLVVVLLGVLLWEVVTQIRIREPASFRSRLEKPAFSALIWTTAGVATSVILLPALLAEPVGTLQQLWQWTSSAATDGHRSPTFFMGDIQLDDPGWLFYPVTLLWRLTPISLVGLVFFAGITFRNLRSGTMPRATLFTIAILVVFTALYAAGMTYGAKKFDRYLLPVYSVFDLFAAIGFCLLATEIARRQSWQRTIALSAIASFLVIGQGMATFSTLPYRLDYYNPLLGGAVGARDVMQMGWGQGGDQVVAFITHDAPPDQDVTVLTSTVNSVFSYFPEENIDFEAFSFTDPASWYRTDFFVAGIQEWQRDLSVGTRLVSSFEPVHVVEAEGVPYFKIYTPRSLPLPEELARDSACSMEFGESIRLVQIEENGDRIDLYWTTSGTSAPSAAKVSMRMVPGNPASEAKILETSGTWSPAAKNLMSRITLPDPSTESYLPLDHYWLEISVTDAVTGEVMPVTRPWNAEERDSAKTVTGCYRISIDAFRDLLPDR